MPFLIQEPNVSMIITDYWMPEMTGYDLLKKIKVYIHACFCPDLRFTSYKLKLIATIGTPSFSHGIYTNAGIVGAEADSRGDHVFRERAHEDHQVRFLRQPPDQIHDISFLILPCCSAVSICPVLV
jgi:CheY-like chemotaxis protein